MDAQALATQIVLRLVKAGFTAYFAGGWVRDHVLKHPSEDIDIATDAPPEKILDLFPRTILVGLAFGVVIVVMDGHQFEVATFRRDLNYLNGRKPEQIELSTPQEDAKRRDFTINGMFYDPLEKVIHDFVNGVDDLRMGIIRTIGDPQERFFEDRLRMIRAIRFATRFGFAIDQETQTAIVENADTLFPAVAMERVWQEFNKMAGNPHFDKALIEMHRLGLLPVVFPALKGTHLNDIRARVASFAYFPENTPTILYLMELFPGLSWKEKVEICQYLRITNRDIHLVETFERFRHLVNTNDNTITVADWTHFYAHPSSSLVINVFAATIPLSEREAFLEKHKLAQNKLKEHIERVRIKKPLVSADLLKKEGIAEGKLVGILLKEAENIAILQDIHDPQTILHLLKKSSNWPGTL